MLNDKFKDKCLCCTNIERDYHDKCSHFDIIQKE